MFFTRISINNPWLATMLMLAFVVLGTFSYQRLQVDQFPDVTFPVIVVQTDYPGAAPESVESEVTRKIEEAVNTVSGLRALASRSYAGTSLIVAEFELTVDPAQAAQDVREKVAAIRADFRREIKEPKITRFDPADKPIISFAVTSSSGRSLRELTTLADQVIKKRLENVRGVGQVNLVGGVKREVQIYLKPAQLEALAIGVDQVINAIRMENQELPLGALRSAEQERVVQIQARAVSLPPGEVSSYLGALDLCATLVENPNINGDARARTILPEFGLYKPRVASSCQMVMLSTGIAGSRNPQEGTQLKEAAYTQNPAKYPDNPGYQYEPDYVYDYSDIRVTLRVPTNARSFAFDFVYLTSEYPEWSCTEYNDTFVALLRSAQLNGNISFDALHNTIQVNSALFIEVDPTQLAGTGFGLCKGHNAGDVHCYRFRWCDGKLQLQCYGK